MLYDIVNIASMT